MYELVEKIYAINTKSKTAVLLKNGYLVWSGNVGMVPCLVPGTFGPGPVI